jgi:hypothetical protein
MTMTTVGYTQTQRILTAVSISVVLFVLLL